jgi:integrase
MKNVGKKAPYYAQVKQSARSVSVGPEVVETKAEPKKKAFKRTELDEDMYLQPEEIRALFSVIESRKDRAILRIVYHHGLRAHEVGLLQMSDYRDRDGLLYIRRGKGSISREHRLIPEEAKALRNYIKFDRGTAPGPMFPSRQGCAGMSRITVWRMVKRYCEEAAIRIEKAHPHALKHSCGTHLAERGNAPDAIQDWLGHRDSKSTDIYMHFSKKRRDESVEKNQDWV